MVRRGARPRPRLVAELHHRVATRHPCGRRHEQVGKGLVVPAPVLVPLGPRRRDAPGGGPGARGLEEAKEDAAAEARSWRGGRGAGRRGPSESRPGTRGGVGT